MCDQNEPGEDTVNNWVNTVNNSLITYGLFVISQHRSRNLLKT